MNRRQFFVLNSCATTSYLIGQSGLAPYSARAQGSRIYRVGFLSPGTFARGTNPGKSTEQVLHELAKGGFTSGINLEVIKRQAEARFERLPQSRSC
jgi:hypothetical protein